VAEMAELHPLARFQASLPDWLLMGLVLFAGPSLIAWVLGDSMRYRRAYYANLEERAARLEQDRDAQAKIAAAAERARIARELHDVVAHNVSVMVVQADGAAYALGNDPGRAREALAAISATGRQALTEMRVLLGVLRRNDDDQPQGADAAAAARAITLSKPSDNGLICGAEHNIVVAAGVRDSLGAGPQVVTRPMSSCSRVALNWCSTTHGSCISSGRSRIQRCAPKPAAMQRDTQWSTVCVRKCCSSARSSFAPSSEAISDRPSSAARRGTSPALAPRKNQPSRAW